MHVHVTNWPNLLNSNGRIEPSAKRQRRDNGRGRRGPHRKRAKRLVRWPATAPGLQSFARAIRHFYFVDAQYKNVQVLLQPQLIPVRLMRAVVTPMHRVLIHLLFVSVKSLSSAEYRFHMHEHHESIFGAVWIRLEQTHVCRWMKNAVAERAISHRDVPWTRKCVRERKKLEQEQCTYRLACLEIVGAA